MQAVNGLCYSVKLGQTLGIVGESGSGKSVSSMAIMGLHDRKHTRITGSILLDGKELVGASESEMRRVRGNAAAMIFQDPLSSLHPFFRIGDQIAEAYRAHHSATRARRSRKRRAVDLLGLVGIPNPTQRVDDYPAPVLRRHAAARDDRHGADQRSAPADRRRADDGPRRHRAGADPRPAAGSAGRVRIGDHPHHPRPGRRGGDGRRRAGDVRGQVRGVRAAPATCCSAPRPPLHLGPAVERARPRGRRRRPS